MTIGIPTYKRPDSLAKLLTIIANTPEFYLNSEIMVLNDSGTKDFDEGYDHALKYGKDLKIDYLRNETNIGFARSFCKLIQECKTTYLLLMADDDILLKDHFSDILIFLKEKNPDLLSPQWLFKDGRFMRGIMEARKVEPEEYRHCCGHAPGVIFNVEKARKFVNLVQGRININCAATLTYPLVSFSIPLILSYNNCWWFGKPIAMEGDACASGIKDAHGYHYSTLASSVSLLRQSAKNAITNRFS